MVLFEGLAHQAGNVVLQRGRRYRITLKLPMSVPQDVDLQIIRAAQAVGAKDVNVALQENRTKITLDLVA